MLLLLQEIDATELSTAVKHVLDREKGEGPVQLTLL